MAIWAYRNADSTYKSTVQDNPESRRLWLKSKYKNKNCMGSTNSNQRNGVQGKFVLIFKSRLLYTYSMEIINSDFLFLEKGDVARWKEDQ
jgi:hypothetical protein